MAGKRPWKDYNNTPEMIALCTNCTREDCVEPCPERQAVLRKLRGLPVKAETPVEAPEKRAGTDKRGWGVRYEMDGEWLTLKAWAARYGMKYSTLYGRLYNDGLDLRTALTKPVEEHNMERWIPGKRYEVDGRALTIEEWAEVLGVQVRSLKTAIWHKQYRLRPEEVIRQKLRRREEMRMRMREAMG